MAGWDALSALSRGQRTALVGVALAVLIAGVAVITTSGDDDQAVQTEDDKTTSTDELTTTTDATSTTTEASTTTAAPSTTTPTTTAPPPSTTAAPPPPAAGSLDEEAVLAFAKSGTGGTAPSTQPDAPMCPAGLQRPSEPGDDTVRDIDQWGLVRYCNGVYRSGMSTSDDTAWVHAMWLRIDSVGGGCEGTDFVVIGWFVPSGQSVAGRAAVVATPQCDRSSWDWIEPAAFPNASLVVFELQFRHSAIGSPAAFSWRGYLEDDRDRTVDVVPNSGPEHFVA